MPLSLERVQKAGANNICTMPIVEEEEMENTAATIIASSNDSKAEADGDGDDGDDDDTNQQHLLVSQFLSFTGTTDEEVARQYLCMSDYGLEDAVNSFWAASNTNITTTTTTTTMNYVVGEENDSVDEGGRDDENNCNDEPAEGDGTIQLGSKSLEGQTRTGSSSLREKINSNELQEGSSEQFSDPDDYDYILSEGMEGDDENALIEEKQVDIQSDNDNDDGDNSSDEVVDSSPDYDYLGLDSVYEVAEEEEDEEEHENDHSQITTTTSLFHYNNAEDSGVRDNAIPANNDPNGIYPTKGHKVDIQPMIVEDDDDDGVEEFEDLGEEYILGTMMVRVLQARHVKVCINPQIMSLCVLRASYLLVI
jgi:hypothetical protein